MIPAGFPDARTKFSVTRDVFVEFLTRIMFFCDLPKRKGGRA